MSIENPVSNCSLFVLFFSMIWLFKNIVADDLIFFAYDLGKILKYQSHSYFSKCQTLNTFKELS